MTAVAPNPHSPYADAHPNARHLIPAFLGILPDPGVLAFTACDRMAVVPEEPLTDITEHLRAGRIGSLPPGLCPTCVGVAAGDDDTVPDPETPGVCRECGSLTRHGQWCALCRQDLHEKWWPTRETEPAP